MSEPPDPRPPDPIAGRAGADHPGPAADRHGELRLVLASASPRRHELLRRLDLDFEIRSADIDETPMSGESAEALVARLAVTKAETVLAALENEPPAPSGSPGSESSGVVRLRVLGADTIVVAPDGQILGKPVDTADARRMLEALSDDSHRVLTGVAVASPGRPTRQVVERTTVTFGELDAEAIESYLATKEPYDAAGAYAIQGGAGGFVSRIDGSFDNVVGLPVHRVAQLLGLA